MIATITAAIIIIVMLSCSLVPNLKEGCGQGSFGSTLMKFSEAKQTLWSHATCVALVNALTCFYVLTFRQPLPLPPPLFYLHFPS